MTIRLSVTARGKWRWVPINSQKIIEEANEAIIQRADELNTEITPRLTGNLQESFRHEIEENGRRIRFFWDAPYAVYTDEGFPRSEGRYVPAIDKRLVNKELSPRRQVYRLALQEGFSKTAARAALTTPIRRYENLPPGAAGIFRFSGRPGEGGKIYIRKGLSREREEEVMRHELWHAVEYAAKRITTVQEAEARAQLFALVAGLQQRDIGMHPGFKGHHFSEKFLDQLREDVVSIVQEVIDKQ